MDHRPAGVHGGRARWSFAIAEASGGQAVGGVGLVFPHVPGVAEPGAWVLAECRNAGIAERAAGLLCRWALAGGTGIARLQATVEPWNLSSQRVLEKLGLVREGLLRDYASWRGQRADAYIYSLLPRDLEGRRRARPAPRAPRHRDA